MVVLGGGIAVACLPFKYEHSKSKSKGGVGVGGGWRATSDEPYILPLQTLSTSLKTYHGPLAQQSGHRLGMVRMLGTSQGRHPLLLVLDSHFGQCPTPMVSRLVVCQSACQRQTSPCFWKNRMYVCVNGLVAPISNMGQISQCLAVNGWAPLTLRQNYKVQVNHGLFPSWPLPWMEPRFPLSMTKRLLSY
jgi:hypothetical protein